MSTMMQAWLIDDFGSPDVFQHREIERPQPTGEHDVLVRVAASSINPLDYKIRDGSLSTLAPPRPATLHGDCAGVVEAVGPGVSRFAPGDEIYGCIGGVGALQGATADFAIADQRLLAHRPKSVSFSEAAALPLAAITAVEAIDKAGLRPAERVLVHGGTGGVGHLALQLARARGAQVWATVGDATKAALATELGAIEAVNYRTEDVGTYVNRLTAGIGFDLVFDTVGGEVLERSIQATRLNGRIVTIQARGEHDLSTAHLRGVSVHVVIMLIPLLHGTGRAEHGRILTEVRSLVDSGLVRPVLDERRFTFNDLAEAHAYAMNTSTTGKVVLEHPEFQT